MGHAADPHDAKGRRFRRRTGAAGELGKIHAIRYHVNLVARYAIFRERGGGVAAGHHPAIRQPRFRTKPLKMIFRSAELIFPFKRGTESGLALNFPEKDFAGGGGMRMELK